MLDGSRLKTVGRPFFARGDIRASLLVSFQLAPAARVRPANRIPGIEAARSHDEEKIVDSAARSSQGFVQGSAPPLFATGALVRAFPSDGA
jgi:hypothetical protein